jgi:hypothetical protein
MSHVDFMVAVAITLVIITLVIYYTGSSLSAQADIARHQRLMAAADALAEQLLRTGGSPGWEDQTSPAAIGLISDIKRIPLLLAEQGGYPHSEHIQLQLAVNNLISGPFVYDEFMGAVPALIEVQDNIVNISFWLDFAAGEQILLSVLYFGGAVMEIKYLTAPPNITSAALTERPLPVLSRGKCSALKELDYETVRQVLGLWHDFNLTAPGCTYGRPVRGRAVVVTEQPVLIETENGIIAAMARISVW